MVTAYIENDKRKEKKKGKKRLGTEIKSRKDFPSRFTVN